MKKASITSLGMSPEEERRRRMIKYSVAMGVRMVCIILMLFSHGWWLVIFGLGAIVLPYVAVVIANQPRLTGTPVERPGGIVPLRHGAPRDDPAEHRDRDAS